MVPNYVEVLNALDTTRTQWYHFKAIVIAGTGFFTDAYDLFSISTVSKLLGRLYFYDPATRTPGKLPTHVNNIIIGVTLFGALIGHLVFGWLGDKLGHKRVYGLSLILMVSFAILSGFSFGSNAKSVIGSLCFFRFWLGFGIGGDYPLSATIMCEYANKKSRGAFMAAVFAMQGMGTIFAGLVSMTISKNFLRKYSANPFSEEPILSTQPEADFLWRFILILGALPAALTYYWRMKMPETASYTSLVKGNAEQAAIDMRRVLEIEVKQIDKVSLFKSTNNYNLFSNEFYSRHGRHLFGTMSTWFLLNIAFYGQNLMQRDIYSAMGLVKKNDYELNAIQEVYDHSCARFVVTLLSTFPGYLFTIVFIERLGRFTIQLVGFLMMSIFMLIMGLQYGYLIDHNKRLFSHLYMLTFFFANFGPNVTTFIFAAELFPTRLRSTCHALSAAAGKTGAIIGTFLIQFYTSDQYNVDEIKHVLMILAFTSTLGFCCTFLLPETMWRSLEHISGEDGDKSQTNKAA